MPLPRPAFQLHRLLGARVTGTVVVAPSYLELLFHTGDRLRATDVSEVYESFTLSTDAPQRLIVV